MFDLSVWFLANKSSLNVEKTIYTVFGCCDCSQAKITLAINAIKQVSSCKYLGVYIDQDVKWTVHIDYVKAYS